MPLNTSHLKLAKFAYREDTGYQRVMRRVQELVEKAPRVITGRFSSTTGNHTNLLISKQATDMLAVLGPRLRVPIFLVPFHKNADLIRRVDVLAELQEMLPSGSEGQLRAALWGLGGIG